jgi:hypothetical protein
MPTFTPENAREFALKGNEVRWSREAQKEKELNPVRIAELVAEDANQARARAIERQVKQMAKFDDMIDKETDAKELHMLTASRERIFREWCALTRNPISGTFKATPEKPNSRRGTFVDPT